MKNNNSIEDLFKDTAGNFDIIEPSHNHELRFLQKLENQSKIKSKSKLISFWKPLLASAACLVIAISILTGANNTEQSYDLANVSEEMALTQDIFNATINEELGKLNAERSPLTEGIIYEAERQLKALEQDYSKLKIDLQEIGNHKRVIYAMIANYQSRINILTDILEKIEDLKQTTHDTENTL